MYCHLLSLYAEYILQNVGLDAGIKITEKILTSDMLMIPL